jgi:hypothetical protein
MTKLYFSERERKIMLIGFFSCIGKNTKKSLNDISCDNLMMFDLIS